jgi:site-specific recombinase XerD
MYIFFQESTKESTESVDSIHDGDSDKSYKPSQNEDSESGESDNSDKNMGPLQNEDSESGDSNNGKRKRIATAEKTSKKVKTSTWTGLKSKTEKSRKENSPSIEKKENEKKQRRKISCPLVSCKSKVTHLPRHMRDVHKWTKEGASKVLLKYNIRKRMSPEKKHGIKHKDYHTRHRCPISQCHSVVFRLTPHLQKVHKLESSSEEYQNAMLKATVVPDKKHPMVRWKEQRVHLTSTSVKDCEEQQKSARMVDESSVDLLEEENETDNDSGDLSKLQFPTHPVVGMLETWMLSADGGRRDHKTAKQHCSQLFGLLKAIDDTENINSLLDLKLVRNVFLNCYVVEKDYEVGTIKSYLMSLRHFYSFLLDEKPSEVDFDVEEISAARKRVEMWSVSYRKESSIRKWQKLEEDTRNKLTPANIRMFENSKAARDAVKIIGQHSDSTESAAVTQSSYTLVRDFLFTQIFTDNANRPGVLADMTMDEYRRAQEEDGDYLIYIMNHKTAHVYGPAILVLSSKLMSWLRIFVEVMRAQVTTSHTGPVFLTWNAQGMTSGQITKAVQSVFRKAGVDIKVTSTSFRKAAVTKVHEDHPELSGKLSMLMAHKEATAKKYYLLTEKSKASLEASRELGKLMRNEGSSDQRSSQEEAENGRKELEENSEAAKSTDVNDVECNMANEGPTMKGLWTESDLKKVHSYFKDEIRMNTITLDNIRRRIEGNVEFNGISPRRIYDRLKKDIKKGLTLDDNRELPNSCELLQDRIRRMEDASIHSEEQDGTTFDENSSVSIIPPSERNSNFNDTEVRTLHKIFEDMIYHGLKISQPEIENRCAKIPEGKKLLNTLSVVQMLNRIKYERRKHTIQSNTSRPAPSKKRS